MSLQIIPDASAYGPKARASGGADLLELLALRSKNPSAADFDDWLNDAKFKIPLLEDFDPGESDSEEEDEDDPDAKTSGFTSSGDRVFALIAERAIILGEKYPFELRDKRLFLRPNVKVDSNPYIALLSMTVAHCFRVKTSNDPKEVFEDTVVAVLTEMGWLASSLSRARKGASFAAALQTACKAVELVAVPGGVVRPRRAKDEGVDTLAHRFWNDPRPGKWTLIGQVTCGQSDTWEKKIVESSLPLWRGYLGDRIDPQPFLAIPYHVEPLHLKYLVQNSARAVLDRLRLVCRKTAVLATEASLVQEVSALEVEY